MGYFCLVRWNHKKAHNQTFLEEGSKSTMVTLMKCLEPVLYDIKIFPMFPCVNLFLLLCIKKSFKSRASQKGRFFQTPQASAGYGLAKMLTITQYM